MTLITTRPLIPRPLSSVTPFTYRDGWTYLELIENMRGWIGRELVPIVNENSDAMNDAFELAVETLTQATDNYTEFQQGAQAAVDAVESIFNELQTNGPVVSINGKHGIVEVYTPYLDVRDYGATGDDTTDDTAAIQAALDAISPEGIVYIPHGRYVVTDTLTVDKPVTLEGPGIIAAAPGVVTVIHATADNVTLSVKIDGQGNASTGIHTTGQRATVRNSVIRNLFSENSRATGVWFENASGCIADNNLIENVEAVGDGITGNVVGASRAILVSNSNAATEASVISNNIARLIIGEEGDAIHVSFGSEPFTHSHVTVVGNIIEHVSRRGIKVQAASTVVTGNTVRETVPPTNASHAIDIIGANNAEVTGNTVICELMGAIQVAGSSTYRPKNIKVTGNKITNKGRPAIYIIRAAMVDVSGNTIDTDSAGIWVTESSDVSVLENTVFQHGRLTAGIRIAPSTSRIIVKGNNGFGDGSAETWYFIQTDAPDTIVANNTDTMPASPGCVRAAHTGSSRSEFSGNTSVHGNALFSSASQAIHGPNTGVTNTSSGAITWVTDDPTVSRPDTAHAKGDIAFNKSATNSLHPLGWICTVAGTPGTWRAMPNIV